MQIEYRTPAAKDLPAIFALMPALYKDIGEGLAKVIAEFIDDKTYFKLIAAERGSAAVAGFLVGCCRLEVDFEGRAGVIEEIVVHPDYRGKGLGKSMLAEFEKWCAARRAIGVLVPCGRPGFYEKMGFEKLPVTRYWKDLPSAGR